MLLRRTCTWAARRRSRGFGRHTHRNPLSVGGRAFRRLRFRVHGLPGTGKSYTAEMVEKIMACAGKAA